MSAKRPGIIQYFGMQIEPQGSAREIRTWCAEVTSAVDDVEFALPYVRSLDRTKMRYLADRAGRKLKRCQQPAGDADDLREACRLLSELATAVLGELTEHFLVESEPGEEAAS